MDTAVTVHADLQRIVVALKAHFAAHPNAADSVEGISAWWLHGDVSKHLVEQALKELANQGFVTTRRTTNGTVIYALKKGHENNGGESM